MSLNTQEVTKPIPSSLPAPNGIENPLTNGEATDQETNYQSIVGSRSSPERADRSAEPRETHRRALFRSEWRDRHQPRVSGEPPLVAASKIRRALVERALWRQRNGWSANGIGPIDRSHLSLDNPLRFLTDREILSLDWVLDRMAEVSVVAAQVVELRTFGGFGIDQIARCLRIDRGTADRKRRFGCLFIANEVDEALAVSI